VFQRRVLPLIHVQMSESTAQFSAIFYVPNVTIGLYRFQCKLNSDHLIQSTLSLQILKLQFLQVITCLDCFKIIVWLEKGNPVCDTIPVVNLGGGFLTSHISNHLQSI